MNKKMNILIDEYIRQKQYRLVNSILLYRDSQLILERYYNGFGPDSRNPIKSVWKSILSVCAGICLDKGYIKSLDQPVADYLEPFAVNAHPYHKLITIRHLLTMTSGIYWNNGIHYHCPMLEQLWQADDCVGHLADIAMANVPGKKFAYKEWDVILLSAVIGKAAGQGAYQFCREYLYEPLGISSNAWAQLSGGVDYSIGRTTQTEAQSDLSARDLAKIGFLFLHHGAGIVSEQYVRDAVSPSKQADEYGYLWWRFDGGYACRGYGGQAVQVLPEQNLVYVIQATPTMRGKEYPDVFDYIITNMEKV